VVNTRTAWDAPFDEAFRGIQEKPIPVVTVAGVEVACDSVLLPLTITHGRSSPQSQPDAPSIEMTVKGRVPWQRNDPISVAVDGIPRFAGFIDSITTDFEGQVFVTKVSGIGWQAKAGAVKPSIPPRPIEDDVARATAYLSAFRDAFGPWDFRIIGQPTNNLVGQDVDGGYTVLALMQDVCDSTGAILWQARDGALVYGTASHRAAATDGALTYISDCDILDGIEWVKNGAVLVNKVKIQYGPVTNSRAVYEATDAASIATEGPKEVSIDSLLEREIDAHLLANLILFRRAKPYWTLPGGILVRTRQMTLAEYRDLLDLDVSDLVMIRVSRNPADAQNLVEWAVEGWVEEWNVEAGELHHTMLMSLSDRQRFGVTGIRTVGELADDTDAALKRELDGKSASDHGHGSVPYAGSAGNADTVDGHHFLGQDVGGQWPYVWVAAAGNGDNRLMHIGHLGYSHGHHPSQVGIRRIEHNFGTVAAGKEASHRFGRSNDEYPQVSVLHSSTYIVANVHSLDDGGFTIEVRNTTASTNHTNVRVIIHLVRAA
jgi:hypothetical protein